MHANGSLPPDASGIPTNPTDRPSAEAGRLAAAHHGAEPWKRWGPYVSDRQWGTVREDYSSDGEAWTYFTHEHARSRAYRWGEDGLAGISDQEQQLCLALALWNGRDEFLKERLFGLTNAEGNHGEDVKELYYYLDAVPTFSYMRMLYKYPQRPFPYQQLRSENARRGRDVTEFELLDTGIFDDDRYWDVFVEYAKRSPEEIVMRITVHNRGPDEAVIHVLPQLWFRNTWSFEGAGAERPTIAITGPASLRAYRHSLGARVLQCSGTPELLLCNNETNLPRLFQSPASGPFKDGFHDYLVQQRTDACRRSGAGTKAAALYVLSVASGSQATVEVALTPEDAAAPLADTDALFATRRREADVFYDHLQQGMHSDDARNIQRQALAGMLWSQQYYQYDVRRWLQGDPGQPTPPAERLTGRNSDWSHLKNGDIISMPDKWEFPWYASWDLAFHCLPLALVDAEFAKEQLLLFTREWYMHPNGQLPAYEWKFSDVNPPVHAWATWRVFQIDRKQRGDHGDVAFLERVFHKLLINFTWWVNRKDAGDRNIFQGGFLGLDNIGLFDRSEPLPDGGHIDQADGTSWMAMYALNMMRIALELALHNRVYEDVASKFFEHFLYIAQAMTNIGGQGLGLWNEEDGFYYDELRHPSGEITPIRLRSMVGLIPLFAVETLEPQMLERLPQFHVRLQELMADRPDLARLISRWHEPGLGERRLLSLLRGHRMKTLLRRMLDESEFLAEHGVRALSKHHAQEPFSLSCSGHALGVSYVPGESDTGLFGGNSNWRGPIWFPMNYLIIESLQRFHHYYGDEFRIECPTGSGQYLTIEAVALELSRRLSNLFLRDSQGRRAIFGQCEKQQSDPHFRNYLLFHEYFHGDTGRGLGASHQTGWTGLIAKLLHPRVQAGECTVHHGDAAHREHAVQHGAGTHHTPV